MPNIKIDSLKYYVFIYKPTNSYVIIEKHSETIFEKLLVIYDFKFDKISDNQLVQVQFLDFDSNKKAYCLVNNNFETIKVNELLKLPIRTKLAFEIRQIFRL
jgi:hypothetical protein